MKRQLPDHETVLEIGIVAFAGLLLVGSVALLLGRLLGGARERGRRAEGPPGRGTISPARHQNITSPAPR